MKSLSRKPLFRKHLFGLAVILMLTGALTMTSLAETYSATTMRLLRYDGTVEIEDASGQSRAAVVNARFNSGESLHTGPSSSASVGLDSFKIITLDENTRVQFTKQSSAMRVSVTDGTVFLDVKEKLREDETLDVETSTMAVGIRGTIVTVSDLPLEVFRQKMAEMKTDVAGTDSVQNQYLTDLDEALQNIPSDGSGGRVSTIGLFEGSVEIQFINSTGTRQTLTIEEGQKATLIDLNEDGEIDRVPVQGKVDEDDLFPAAKEEIDNDSTLNDRINNGGSSISQNNDQGGQKRQQDEWTDDTSITVIAQSASKMFDGKPLTRESDVLIQGLPAGYTAFASASGSQTDAGTGDNRVDNFKIYDSKGNDVTSHFTNISKVSGKLKVDPAPLSVSSGSASKVYDGTPLTSNESQIIFSAGYEKKTVTQRNLSYVVTEKTSASVSAVSTSSDAPVQNVPNVQNGQNGQNEQSGQNSQNGQNAVNPGAQTLYGICGTVLVHGSNPLTGEVREFSLHAGERLTVYLSDKDNENSIEYVIEKIAVEELPEDILCLYKDNPDLMAQACLEAGWLPGDLQKRIDDLNIRESEKKTKDNNGLYVDSIDQENLMKDFTNVRITVDTAGTDYNKRALNREEAHFTPVNVDTSIKVVTTGTITDVGTVNNTFTIDWGSAKKENYILKETVGTLTVKPASATVTTGSAKKEYDGTPLTSSKASIRGLVNGETAAVTATGSITEVGTAENTYDISWGTAKKGNYTVSSNTGTLKVTGNTTPVTIRISFTGKTYDGKPLDIDHFEVVGKASDNVKTQSRASDTIKAQSRSTGNVTVEGLPAGYRFKATVSGKYTDAGTCRLTVDSYQILDPDGKDVTDGFTVVEIAECTVTIYPAPVTVTTGSALKAYDGKPLTSEEASITGLIGKDAASVTLTATGSITDVGTSDNTYDLDWGNVKTSNYSLTESLGTLEVTKNSSEIIFKALSDSKTYDGTPLQADSVTVTGLPEGFTFTASASGAQTDAGSSESTVSSYKILNADGNDVTDSFSNIKTENGTLTITPAEATVSTGSASKEYDSNPLICAEASISGLIDADKDAVTVTAAGIITDVGTTENTFTIDWGSAKSGNYTLSESLGTLEITQNTTEITFKAPSATKTYDGTPLQADTVTVTGLPEGFTSTASASGSQTDAGSSESTVASYKILNADEADVTASFSNIKTEKGTMTVNPAAAAVATGSASKEYDGKPLTSAEASISGLIDADKDAVTVTAAGTITDAGTATNTYSIDWGLVNSENYTLTEELGTLKVIPLKIEFDLNCYEADYCAGSFALEWIEGTYSDSSEVEVQSQYNEYDINGDPASLHSDFLVPGGMITLECDAVTDAGTYTITPETTYSSDAKKENYDISFTNDTMKINPAEVRFSVSEGTVVYDGKYHGTDLADVYLGGSDFNVSAESGSVWRISWDYTNIPNEYIEVNIPETGGTNVGEYPIEYSCSFGNNDPDNYKITVSGTTLTIQQLELCYDLSKAWVSPVGLFEHLDVDNTDVVYLNGSDEGVTKKPYQVEHISMPKIIGHFSLTTGEEITIQIHFDHDQYTYWVEAWDITEGDKNNYSLTFKGEKRTPETAEPEEMTVTEEPEGSGITDSPVDAAEPDKSQQANEQEQYKETGNIDQPDKPDKNEEYDDPGKTGDDGKSEEADKPENPDDNDVRAEENDKAEKPDDVSRAEEDDKTGKTDDDNEAEEDDKAEKPDDDSKAEEDDKAGKPDDGNEAEEDDKAGKPDDGNEAEETDKARKPDDNGKAEEDNKARKPAEDSKAEEAD